MGRALDMKEIDIIKLWAEPMVKELSYCYNQKDKDNAYNFYFNIIEGVIHG
jgi:hypothetical protein